MITPQPEQATGGRGPIIAFGQCPFRWAARKCAFFALHSGEQTKAFGLLWEISTPHQSHVRNTSQGTRRLAQVLAERQRLEQVLASLRFATKFAPHQSHCRLPDGLSGLHIAANPLKPFRPIRPRFPARPRKINTLGLAETDRATMLVLPDSR